MIVVKRFIFQSKLAREGDGVNLSFFEKIGILIKCIFSSFLSIEMLILSLLLLCILILNLKRDDHFVQMLAIGIYIGFIVGILITYTTYVKSCIHSFIKAIMNYVYFPSTVVYFFIILFVTFMILFTLFSKKLTTFKKIFNFSFFSIMYLFFLLFISLATYDAVDLIDTVQLYENNVILTLVQSSNFLLTIWVIYTEFYWLYRYFKKKYD